MSSYDNNSFEGDGGAEVSRKRSGPEVAIGSNDERVLGIERRRMLKNVVVISIAFMCLFTAFQSMANLQSSINKVAGLGTYSLVTIYASLVLSCMFLPSVLIKKLSVKWTMVFSMLCYTTYILAQFYPSFLTLLPAAFILGMGAAPMWSAKCTYLTQVGNKYGELTGQATEPVIVRFFGIFFLFFQFASVIGNLISSQVLSRGQTVANVTEEALTKCGINYCPVATTNSDEDEQGSEESDDVESNFSVNRTNIYILASIYLASSLLSVILVSFIVDPLTMYGENEREEGKKKYSGKELLVATFRHMKKPFQILIIPLTIWSGVEQGFFGADFTAGYVSCAYGVHNVGYVLMVYGVCDALCSFGFGVVIKAVGRLPIFVVGAVVNVGVVYVLFTWTPSPDQAPIFFVLAGLWGVADAVWQTQINALYGVLFASEEEAAFSNYRLWESLGFIFAYVLQTQVCILAKLWVLLIVIGLGMAGYLAIEISLWRNKPSQE